MLSSTKRSLRFGIFELDPQSCELFKRGIKLKLGDQPARILLRMLETPGEVVTREELRHLLWGQQTFVDFEHGLNAAINKLREVLGDTAVNPRFIETIPRHGYRFLAEVVGHPAPVELNDSSESSWLATSTSPIRSVLSSPNTFAEYVYVSSSAEMNRSLLAEI